jgi:hypothetical protein
MALSLVHTSCCMLVLFAGSFPTLPDDLDSLYQSLKEAQTKKDAAQVKKLAVSVCALARKAQAEPAPTEAAGKDAWTRAVAHAKEIELFTEYALSATAAGAPPATVVDLISTLEQQNPKSKYLDEMYPAYLAALSQTGAASKIPAVAEKALANFPSNDDLLMVVADNAMSRSQSARAGALAERALVVLSRHPAPAGASAADWERRRATLVGRAHWMAGIAHAAKGQDFEADKDLRAALPMVKDNEGITAQILFSLGVSNYNLGRTTANKEKVLEAIKFSERAAAFAGPLQQMAWRNAQVMKTEASRMR